MTLSAEQQAIRATGVGGAEIAAVCGLHPYMTASDVYSRKVGEVRDTAGHVEAVHWGNVLEPHIADRYQVDHDCDLTPGITHKRGIAVATPDYEANHATAGKWLLECKTAGHFSGRRWGPSGTEEVPLEYICQVVWQMGVLARDRCDVAVLIGGQDYRTYTIRYSDALYREMLARAERFWLEHVEARVKPQGPAEPDPSVRKLAERSTRVRTAETHEVALLEAYRLSCETLAAMTADHDALEARVIDALGHDAGLEASGVGRITYRAAQGRVNWRAVAEAMGASTELAEKHRGAPSMRLTKRWEKK